MMGIFFFVSLRTSGGDGITWLTRRENWAVGQKATERKEFKLMYCEAPNDKGFLQYRMIMEKKSGSRYMTKKMKVYYN